MTDPIPSWSTAPDLLTVDEAAGLMRCHNSTVYRRLEDGRWDAFAWKLGNDWRIEKAPLLNHLRYRPVHPRESAPDPMPKPNRVRFRERLANERRRAMA
jgi:excisionase family DNA binding protein